jgi:hypothetical protein
MTQYAQQCYSELNSLVDTCYRVYPEQARTIVTRKLNHPDSILL